MLLRVKGSCVPGLLMVLAMYASGQSLEYAESCLQWYCDVEGQICPKGASGASDANYKCIDSKWMKLEPKSKIIGDEGVSEEWRLPLLSGWGNECEDRGTNSENNREPSKWSDCIELGGKRLAATTECLSLTVFGDDNGGVEEGWDHSTANKNCFSKEVLKLWPNADIRSSVGDVEDVEVDPDTFVALRGCMAEYDKGYGPGTGRDDGGAGYWWVHVDGCCKETGVEGTGGCESVVELLEDLCRDPGGFEWCDDGRCEGHKRCLPYELW